MSFQTGLLKYSDHSGRIDRQNKSPKASNGLLHVGANGVSGHIKGLIGTSVLLI